MTNLDPAFFGELRDAASKMPANPADVLLVLYGESGLNPASPGHVSAYEGLNQINQPYLKTRGIDPADYLTWPASRQMREVVGPFLVNQVHTLLKKAVRSAGVLEACNLYPANVARHGDAPEAIIIDSQSPDAGERQAFQANKALDRNGDGKITISDLDEWLTGRSKDKAFQAELARLGGSPTPIGGGLAAMIVLVAVLGGLAYYLGYRW
jgi:hypothetical protein